MHFEKKKIIFSTCLFSKRPKILMYKDGLLELDLLCNIQKKIDKMIHNLVIKHLFINKQFLGIYFFEKR